MNSAAAVNAIKVPGKDDYPPPANTGIRPETYLSNIYWQHTVELLQDRLILVGGVTRANLTTSSIANVAIIPFQATVVPIAKYLHRVGVVVKPLKDVSIYAMEGTTFQPAGAVAAVLKDGSTPPAQEGKGREIGIKTALWDGKVSVNFGWFHMTTSNIIFFAGVLPNGVSYYDPIGSTVQEGVDGDVQLTVLPGWQFISSFYAGHNRDQADKPVSGSYDNSLTFFTRYDFQKDSALKGLSVGGGLQRFGGQWISTAGITGYTFNAFQQWFGNLKIATASLVNVFSAYQVNRNLTVRFGIQNLLDKVYAVAEQTVYFADPSPPRTYTFGVDYKF